MPSNTELDALLDRVREDKADPTGKNRMQVAFDCWRMFEDLARRYKEEFSMRDRYKSRSDAWRDKALELNDKHPLPEGVLAEWIFHQFRYRALDKGSYCWIVSRELATEDDFPTWQVEKIL